MLKLGATLFAQSDVNSSIDQTAIDNALLNIERTDISDQSGVTNAPPAPEPNHYPEGFPVSIRKLIPQGTGELDWKNLGPRLSVAKLRRLDPAREIALHRLQPGGVVSDHDHGGCEITVVLSGSFSDLSGQYHPGDFLVRNPGETHRPTASEDGPCVCLAVFDAPVKFTGVLTRFLNPLVAIQHRL